MASESRDDVSLILEAVGKGDRDAESRLFRIVYAELHRVAHDRMARERPGHTLQTTALIHESYLRLVSGKQVSWQNRAHFFGAAARAMSQILIESARKKRAGKRGGGERPVTYEEVEGAGDDLELQLALHEALSRLELKSKRKADVVRYRHILGFSVVEISDILAVSPRTVTADWEFARAWLKRELGRIDMDQSSD